MGKGFSVINILQENRVVNEENNILQKEVEFLVKRNAILEAENIILRRYRDLYVQYVLWKDPDGNTFIQNETKT